MTSNNADRSLDAIYDDLWGVNALVCWAAEQQALQPRAPSHLFDLVAGVGLTSLSTILDVGCGQGDHACELTRRFGARVVALDPVHSNLEHAHERVRRNNLAARVQVQKGCIERLPFSDEGFDLVWCRSVIVHLPALLPAFRECWRVLVRGGFMMLQTGFATALLEPQEGALLRRRLSFLKESMLQPQVESAFLEAGFAIVRSEAYGSEFAEFYEGQESRCARYLMGIAQLQRAEATLVDNFGRASYETALGTYYWQVYQMLGKISYHAYLLVKN
ncbi:MAG: class I SAM-dependent methyltransferase [Pseudonocardiaceae bacterium]